MLSMYVDGYLVEIAQQDDEDFVLSINGEYQGNFLCPEHALLAVAVVIPSLRKAA
jgi:hypothetical protein